MLVNQTAKNSIHLAASFPGQAK